MKKTYITIGIVVACALGLVTFGRHQAGLENYAQANQPPHAALAGGDHQDHAGRAGHEEENHSPDLVDEHDGHAGHDEHGDHGGRDVHDEEVVSLSETELREFGIRLATAGPGTLSQHIELPGEIVLNSDRLAHVVPRVSGIVRQVGVTVGDRVEAGSVMAVIESRELADAKAAFLAAAEREKLARANFSREKRLWEKKVTSEQEFLDARQGLAEARIERNSAEQQLHALGISDGVLEQLPTQADATYTRFEIRAPLGGTIIDKHMTLGENVAADADVFTIADLSTVWVNLNIYQKDLVRIRRGQTAVIETGHGIPPVEGTIAWVSPQVDEATRTAMARIELANPDGAMRPGLFVSARVTVGSSAAGLVVPKSALQTFEERPVLFVQTDEGFAPMPVEIGRRNGTTLEILAGLMPGQTYVSEGAFTLKAQLSKGAFGDGHNH